MEILDICPDQLIVFLEILAICPDQLVVFLEILDIWWSNIFLLANTSAAASPQAARADGRAGGWRTDRTDGRTDVWTCRRSDTDRRDRQVDGRTDGLPRFTIAPVIGGITYFDEWPNLRPLEAGNVRFPRFAFCQV